MGSDRDPTPAQTFELITLFGDAVQGFLSAGLMAKALESGRLAVHCTDPRDFTDDRHRTVDDAPFGGGPGMVMKAEPVIDALEHVVARRGPVHTILVTPSAPRLDQAAARRLAEIPRIAILCGRYEGIDDRVREGFVDECLSLGDFVLNGGELAALAIVEAVGRLVPGVLGNPASTALESFSVGSDMDQGPPLEHPQYTRPEDFRGRQVPAVLRSGDHERIETWRRQLGWLRTWRLRPELVPPEMRNDLEEVWVLVEDDAASESELLELVATVQKMGGAGLVVWDRANARADPGGRERRHGRGIVFVSGAFGRVRRVLRKRGSGEPCLVSVVEGAASAESRSGVVVRDGNELAVVLRAARSGAETGLGPVVLDFSGVGGVPEGAWLADLALGRGTAGVSTAVPGVEGLAIDTAMIDPSQPRSRGSASTEQAETPASPRASTLSSRVFRAFATLEIKQ